ncbi:MAG: peptidoglycan editing factor PgeF [Bacillus sp. (in: firmicutes)]
MRDIFVKKSESILSVPEWGKMDSELVVGFTTKNGGISKGEFSTLNTGFHVHDIEQDVVANRCKIADEIGMPVDNWTGAEQTHRDRIIEVTAEHKGMGARDYHSALKDTDGLFTKETGILLTLCYADCVPVYFFAPKHHYVGIVHAGWKGTVLEIAGTMVDRWAEKGIEPKDIYAVIGPSICQKCYVVDDKVIEHVDKIVTDEGEKPYNLSRPGQYYLDLRQLNNDILRRRGVGHVDVTSYCTSCHHREFFSHRRDHGKTGRLMSFIGWKEETLNIESNR